ncbi:MAG: hypothetical protein IKJ65_12910 [Clostridia bacterium]|nr:hypothetical protein [Clostridia bacterium]
MERERIPSPFSIDFDGVYGEIARFYKAERLKTLPLSDRRPEIPKDFRRSAPPIKKGTFLMD